MVAWSGTKQMREWRTRLNKSWFAILFPPLLLVLVYLLDSHHAGVRSCSPFPPDLILIVGLAFLVALFNLARRSLKIARHTGRGDRRIYRSLLTSIICVGLFFHYSRIGAQVDQLLSGVAEEIQGICTDSGICPDNLTPVLDSGLQFRMIRPGNWEQVDGSRTQHFNLKRPASVGFWYRINKELTEFSVNYCRSDNTIIRWAGGVSSTLSHYENTRLH